jgi:hypothetical protein
MTRKQQLALIAAVVMAEHDGLPARDAVQIADHLLQHTELAVECHIPN